MTKTLARPVAATIAAAGLVAGIAALAGCGAGDPLASQTAAKIAGTAARNLQSSPGFTVDGTFTTGTTTDTGHLAVEPGRGCDGSISQTGKGSFGLIIDGSQVWIQPSRQWLVGEAGPQIGGQMASAIGDRFVSGVVTAAQMGDTCKASSITSSLTGAKNLAKKPVTSIDGQSVVPLYDKASGRTWYVTDTPSPSLVRITSSSRSGSSKAVLTYHPVSVTAPAAADTISAGQAGL